MNPEIKFPIFCREQGNIDRYYKLISPTDALIICNYDAALYVEFRSFGSVFSHQYDTFISGEMEIITEAEFMELKKIVQDKLDAK